VFTYNDTTYHFLSTEDYVARTDENYQQDLEVFADANEMLKAFQIEGAPLYQIADELKNVDIL
jgi:3'-phosphoadenosine 5'-phosphosulfate sulfotransferase (PAPS reductase)/FAD synthetase